MTLSSADQPGLTAADPPEAQLAHLVALYQQGLPAAVAEAAAVLTVQYPEAFALQQLAGLLLAAGQAYALAEPHFARAARLHPQDPEIHLLHGTALGELGQLHAAAEAFARAVAIAPDHAEALGQLGMALFETGQRTEALCALDRALACAPRDAQICNNRGVVLQDLARLNDAAVAYEAALAFDPGHIDARANLGAVRKEQGRTDEALRLLEQALAENPSHFGAWDNFGAVLGDAGRLPDALAANARALALRPGSTAPLARSIEIKTRICDWSGHSDFAPVAASLGIAGEAVPPHPMLALDLDPARQRQRAERYAAQTLTRSSSAAPFAQAVRNAPNGRLRIGYFSADFHDHATMYLLAGLLRCHDRSRYEIFAYSYGIDRDDAMRRAVVDHCDHFFDLRSASDQVLVEHARGAALDIAVDLKGYTQDHRCQIFADRMAPVQISYLGFPGTLGAPFFDYIVADAQVIPPHLRAHYSEAVVFLPGSYQANDNQRPIGPIPSRAACGLPEDAFVFACFNANSKIGPDAFAIWMRLLGQVERSVLWLFRSHPLAEAHLRAAAVRCGIDPARIHFAERLPQAEHLARIGLGDLFLDTFAVNAHTTASDSLWAGLPVLTMAGESFAARVGASLLHAAGLPELVTTNPADYEVTALTLARDPPRLEALRARLRQDRLTCPLFDTPRFTRAMEAAYGAAHARAEAGLSPADITIA